MRTIKAYSKPARTIKQEMMHGNVYSRSDGAQTVLYAIFDKSDDEIVSIAKDKCKELGLELWKVFVVGSKPTSFSTSATWCERELFLDESPALYFEGVFDGDGNRIE